MSVDWCVVSLAGLEYLVRRSHWMLDGSWWGSGVRVRVGKRREMCIGGPFCCMLAATLVGLRYQGCGVTFAGE